MWPLPVPFAAVGALIATRRPGHRIGWLLLVGSLAISTAQLTWGYVAYGLDPGTLLPGAAVVGWVGRLAALPGPALRPVEVNGGPGALFCDADGQVTGVCAIEIADGRIASISGVVNPDKLAHLGPVADLRSMLRARR